jgi:hypothetical protein
MSFCWGAKVSVHTGKQKVCGGAKMKMRKLTQYRLVPLMNHRISVCILHPLILSLLFVAVMQGQLRAESVMSYPDSKAIIDNNCPYVKLTNFWFENRYERNGRHFVQSMTWTNSGGQSIIAFEIAILRYDAFNQRINGLSWTITGNDSDNWMPLQPGNTGSDITFGLTTEEVFTSIAYVRAVRLKDGTIWRANPKEVLERLRDIAPGIEQFGNVNPEIRIFSSSRTG